MILKNIDNGIAFDFGKTSENYAKYRDIYPSEFYEKLHDLGVGHKGQDWLDLGSGTGVVPRAMYHHGANITATDISENQITQAIRLSEDNGMQMNYKVCPAEETGYADNSFDVITACQCFMYFNKEKTIPEIRRMIKPNGLFVKTYMSFLKEDAIAAQTKALISEFNPSWTASRPAINDFFNDYFDNPVMDSFRIKLNFTRDSWMGRTMTMRGVQAQMDEDVLAEFNRAHEKLLKEIAPDEFTIDHKVFITAYRI